MIMSHHRKVHSHGSIPFSWEDEPRICKTPQGVNQFKSSRYSSSSIFQAPSSATQSLQKTMKIPLPPCPSLSALPARRTASGKGFRWQEDPFLVAYKEIAKTEKISENNKKNKGGGGGGFSSSVRKSKNIFSCKSSSSGDVRHGNFLKLSQLPQRLPRDTSRSFKFGHELKPDFNCETWV